MRVLQSWFLHAAICCVVAPGTTRAPAAELPPPAEKQIDFAHDIVPLLKARCAQCHGQGQRKGGFQIDTRETLLKGGDAGPAVVEGRSAESYLIELVAAEEPEIRMPKQGEPLTAAEIGLLRAWIDQGISWTDGFTFAKRVAMAPLVPRRPDVPPGEADNPVDRFIDAYNTQHGLEPGALVDDRTFARRAWLDVVGLLPPPGDAEAFVADSDPRKRAALVDRLLTDRRGYTEHWLSFWNDCLRNDYRGTGYIDGGRKQITSWLYQALYDNMPLDEFVRQLIAPSSESEGFIKGIVWRGVVNASQTPPVQAAQNLSQVFLGINLKCASCHDSFVNDWKLADAYALATIFANEPLELHRCDRPTGQMAEARFLFPELGTIDPAANRAERMKQLAAVFTNPGNGRFARTMVNRLWHRLFGRGIVEPLDDMDRTPFSADLLDWLAVDLADHGYDMQHTLRLLLTSRAYQSAAVPAVERTGEDFVFRGPMVRRLSAEQLVDAVSTLTGVWQTSLAAPTLVRGGDQRARVSFPGAPPETQRFASGVINRGFVEIDVDLTGARTLWLVATDGGNGTHSDWADWLEPEIETPQGPVRLTTLEWRQGSTGYGKLQKGKNVVEGTLRSGGFETSDGLGAHAHSVIVYELPAGTTRFRARAGIDDGALEKSPDHGHDVEFLVLTDVVVRAALVPADALMTVLGRPNREQVVTSRATSATTLQGLEMTNGATLDAVLAQGAARWLASGSAEDRSSAAALIDRIYRQALARSPSPVETDAALEVVGVPATVEGVQDLLWIVTMLPEFQLIH